jgi:tetratricopeptide (TPR) repeat protein
MDRGVYSKTDSSILFYNPICKEVVETLRDSIRVGNNLIENLTAQNIMLLHQETILVDSIHKNIFLEEVSQSKKNKATRHLSRSLRFFYDGRYRDALSEVNTALEEDPKFAIAYGRRGSIYYQLGDIRRATLNWNAALQLDPEFTEIYDMLKTSDENRLKSVEISKNLGEN